MTPPSDYPTHLIEDLLKWMGEDPKRQGLRETPMRVLRAWREMTQGYHETPERILSREFTLPYNQDQVIACTWIDFHSTCEHHLLPFSGVAHVGYLPKEHHGRVVGLSKLARLVDCFARRLQIQERLTCQIADTLNQVLQPRGVAVIIQAQHLCMVCRGVRKHESVMVTSAMHGVFREEGPARSEFMRLIELSRQR